MVIVGTLPGSLLAKSHTVTTLFTQKLFTQHLPHGTGEKEVSKSSKSRASVTGRERMAVIWGEGCGYTESNCLTLAEMVREAFLEKAALKLNFAHRQSQWERCDPALTRATKGVAALGRPQAPVKGGRVGNEPERRSTCWMGTSGLHPGGGRQRDPSKDGQEPMSSNSPPELQPDFDGVEWSEGCSPRGCLGSNPEPASFPPGCPDCGQGSAPWAPGPYLHCNHPLPHPPGGRCLD